MHAKKCLRTYADRESPDQSAHPHSSIRAFTVHKKNHWILQNVRMESKSQDDTLCLSRMIWMHFLCISKALFSQLKIRGGIHILFFLFLHENICCGYSSHVGMHLGEALLMSTCDICFCGEIRKISAFFGWKNRLICCYVFLGNPNKWQAFDPDLHHQYTVFTLIIEASPYHTCPKIWKSPLFYLSMT